THTPLMGRNNLLSATLFQSKLFLYTTCALGATLAPGAGPVGSFWSTDDPYDYLRIHEQGGKRYAIFGGEDYKTGQVRNPEVCYTRLAKRLRSILPGVKIDHQW